MKVTPEKYIAVSSPQKGTKRTVDQRPECDLDDIDRHQQIISIENCRKFICHGLVSHGCLEARAKRSISQQTSVLQIICLPRRSQLLNRFSRATSRAASAHQFGLTRDGYGAGEPLERNIDGDPIWANFEIESTMSAVGLTLDQEWKLVE